MNYLGKRICTDFLHEDRISKKKISDSAGKIHFGMSSLREAHMPAIFSLRTEFQKNFSRPEKFILTSSHLGKPICTDFLVEDRISKKFQIRPEKFILHELTAGSAYAPIFSLRTEFQKNFRFGQKNSFWHELTAGSVYASIFSLRTEFQKKFQVRPEKFILA